ncbi:DUF4440 domain-containing protein [Rhodocytophaga rosea]|uniref:DUF4440 domain-containing protein n=1 Tax=Rhodocytophaga rosea TaxID=2704465 RepID=A0A6C0GU19_9BACT|nr:DUF4440 domain-containing protein [Rhodocytophaga rosea]QHT71314.1 DUF4440 domain-containing protein [Rhodocytophaga rosea]
MRSIRRNLFITVVAGILVCLLWGCHQAEKNPSTQDVQADIQAVEAVSKARAAAFNQSNAAGIAKHFTADAVLMAPDKPAIKGPDAVQGYYQSIFDAYTPQLKSYYEQVEVSGDMAYGRGFAEVRLAPKGGGDTLFSTAKYLNILKKQPDGSWKTTHDIWNSNEPSR